MSCDPELANEWTRCSGTNASYMYITTVVVGALGLMNVVKKGLDKVTSRIPGNINTNEIHKITILGTAHILRKVFLLK